MALSLSPSDANHVLQQIGYTTEDAKEELTGVLRNTESPPNDPNIFGWVVSLIEVYNMNKAESMISSTLQTTYPQLQGKPEASLLAHRLVRHLKVVLGIGHNPEPLESETTDVQEKLTNLFCENFLLFAHPDYVGAIRTISTITSGIDKASSKLKKLCPTDPIPTEGLSPLTHDHVLHKIGYTEGAEDTKKLNDTIDKIRNLGLFAHLWNWFLALFGCSLENKAVGMISEKLQKTYSKLDKLPGYTTLCAMQLARHLLRLPQEGRTSSWYGGYSDYSEKEQAFQKHLAPEFNSSFLLFASPSYVEAKKTLEEAQKTCDALEAQFPTPEHSSDHSQPPPSAL